jgi:hypothetical protein
LSEKISDEQLKKLAENYNILYEYKKQTFVELEEEEYQAYMKVEGFEVDEEEEKVVVEEDERVESGEGKEVFDEAFYQRCALKVLANLNEMKVIAKDYKEWCEDKTKAFYYVEEDGDYDIPDLEMADTYEEWWLFIKVFKVLGFQRAFNHIYMSILTWGAWNFVKEFDEEYEQEA